MNDRFRDLLDLQLLEALVADDEWPELRSTCINVFDGRGNHAWPPIVTLPPSWEPGYRALAEETGFPVTDVGAAAEAVHLLIARIDTA